MKLQFMKKHKKISIRLLTQEYLIHLVHSLDLIELQFQDTIILELERELDF